MWRRPVVGALAMAAGGAWLRIIYAGYPETSDQLIVVWAALEHVLQGGSPYGVGFAESVPPGSPFVYGPLALLTGPLGVWGEVAAATGTMLLLVWTRSWLTLAAYAGYHVAIQMGVSGINDQIPAFLLLAGLLALERRRVLGGVLIAVAAAVKPHVLAWFPAAMGYGGVATAAALLATLAVLWSPLLVWGPLAFVRSTQMATELHAGRPPENAMNMPALRVLAAPVALASFFVRRWWLVVVSGSIIFMIVLFFDRWASYGYWLVVLPPLGMLIERWWRERQAAVRASAERAATTRAPSS